MESPSKLSLNLCIKGITSFLVLQAVCTSIYANHIVGAFIEYECVEPGVYEVTLNAFQDCFDDLVTEDVNIRVVPDCDFNFFSTSLPLLTNEDITEVCESQISNTLCQEGLLASYRLVRYRGLVNVTTECESFRFMWKINYRGDADNITEENWVFYTHTIVYPGVAPCNNSPMVSEPNIPVRCLLGPGTVNMDISEGQDDSLHFSLTPVLHSPSGINFAPITYSDGFSGSTPVPGASLNESTGRFDYSTDSQGRYFVAIKVDEFNQNGELLSEMHIDFLLVNVTCEDSGLSSGGQELIGLTPGVQSSGPLSIVVCQNQNFCGELLYPIGTEDLDIEVQHDLESILDNVEVSIEMESDSVRVRFCGTTGADSNSSQVLFLVTDNHCPYTNEVSTEVGITVSDDSSPEVFIEFFGGELSMTNPGTDEEYQWYQDGVAISGANSSSLMNLEDGSYYFLTVSNTGDCIGVSNSITIETVGLSESTKRLLSISPNPAKDNLTIRLEGLTDFTSAHVVVHSVLGELVLDEQISDLLTPISLGDIPSGVYQLTLVFDDTSTVSAPFVRL